MTLTRKDIRRIAYQSPKVSGLGLVGTADSIETDGIRDPYPFSFRETTGGRRGSGTLFETEEFVESPALIFPSPGERYVKGVNRFTFLGGRDGEEVTLEADREKHTFKAPPGESIKPGGSYSQIPPHDGKVALPR